MIATGWKRKPFLNFKKRKTYQHRRPKNNPKLQQLIFCLLSSALFFFFLLLFVLFCFCFWDNGDTVRITRTQHDKLTWHMSRLLSTFVHAERCVGGNLYMWRYCRVSILRRLLNTWQLSNKIPVRFKVIFCLLAWENANFEQVR